MITTFINHCLTIILVLIAMAFYTLLEHKVLGYTQHRKGPNKVILIGVGQPGSDAIKLLSKEKSIIIGFNMLIYASSAAIRLRFALFMWITAPSLFPSRRLTFSLLIFILISRCRVYPTIIIGWRSNSKYSLLGAIRRIAQTISYEISMALIIITILIFTICWNYQKTLEETGLILILIMPYIYLILLVRVLAETNRAPFDFAEGERELVSGFNTEYAGGLFVLIFISEYINIIFVSLIIRVLIHNFIDLSLPQWVITCSITLLIATLILIIRSSYPRLRYDQLINLTWLSFLPIRIAVIIPLLNITQ